MMRRWVCTWLCVAAWLALPAYAADQANKKAATALATRAAKAFEAGRMAEAEGLYREAFLIDKSESAYLYGAARAAHAERDLEHAERDYVAFLSLPSTDPVRFRKAEKYLASLRAELSEQKASQAKVAENAGDLVLAVTLYLEAWRMAPDAPEPLLKAAILERKRGLKEAAIAHLQQYLQLATQDATGVETAETLLKELGGQRLPSPNVPNAANTPDAATPTDSRATAGAGDGWGPFGGSLAYGALLHAGSQLTARFSIPISRVLPIGDFQYSFAADVAGSGVWGEGKFQDFVPRLGATWFVRFLPHFYGYLRAHFDWHVAGYNGRIEIKRPDQSIDHVIDRSNSGLGFGTEVGALYKLGPIAFMAEIGTQHIGLAVGLGY